MSRHESLLGRLLRQVVGLVVLVVGCMLALRWVYELLRPMLWLLPVVAVVVAAGWIVRRWPR